MCVYGGLHVIGEVLVRDRLRTRDLVKRDAFIDLAASELWRLDDCHWLAVLLDHDLDAFPYLLQHGVPGPEGTRSFV